MRCPAADDANRPNTSATLRNLIEQIKRLGDTKAVEGMKRYGIQADKAYGVSLPALRNIARQTGKDHLLALNLWRTGIREARLLAGMIDIPERVTSSQMEDWARDFDSWDVVDGTCGNLFDKTDCAVDMAYEWSTRKEPYVKRAGFVLIAELAVHDKKAADRIFLEFLPLIIDQASDERNFVKKAVNWALRQIGKRNAILNRAAIRTCKQIRKMDSKSARWIASDALRELTSESVQGKFSDARKAKS